MQTPNNMAPANGEDRVDLIDRYIAANRDDALHGQGGLIDIAMIRGILYRQKWTISTCVILALLAGVVITLMQTPIYEAQATVRVDPSGNYILDGQDIAPGVHINEYERYVETLGSVVLSRKMAETVTADLKLADRKGFLSDEFEDSRPPNISDARWQAQREAAATDAASSGVDVDVPFDDRIMTISYRSVDANAAALLANGYAQAFLKEDTKRSIEANDYALEYLSEQIADIRNKLQAAEVASNAYARENALVGSMPSVSSDGDSGGITITNETLSSVNSSFTQARAKRIEAEQRWRAVSETPASQLPEVQNNAVVQTLLSDKAKTEAELANLRERYDEGYPEIQELKARIASLGRQISTTSSDIKNSIRNEYRIALRQEQGLEGELDRVSDDALAEKDRQVRFDLLERDAAALRDQLAALLARYNEVSTAANVQAGSITLLDPALVPRGPVSPSLFRNLFIALILGGGLAVMLGLLREAMDDRLRALDDVQRKLGLSLIGHTPHVPSGDFGEDTSNPFSALTESYASIRSTIDYIVPRDQQTLQFTSSQASEGKTTSAVMVAEQWAKLGRRTLLVDADLRRPSVHKHWGVHRPEKGFVDVLLGNASLQEALLPGTSENLDVLCISKPPPNPVELLSSAAIAEFIAKYRHEYSRIIFDSSPVMGIADAPLLSNSVNATIFVAEANRVHGGQAKAAVQRLRDVGANTVGVILTKFKALEAGQGYGSEYRYYTYGEQD